MNPSQQNQSGASITLVWLIVFFFAAVIALWLFEHPFVVKIDYAMRDFEINMMLSLSTLWNKFASFIHLPAIKTTQLLNAKNYIDTSDPYITKWKNFSVINEYIASWVRYPTAFILVVLSAIVFSRGGANRFSNKYNLQKLKKVGCKNWPVITPVLSLDLVKADIEEGPWAMAELPLTYGKKNNLIHVIDQKNRQVWGVDRSLAQQAFTMQLGPLWKGVDALPIHIKAMLVIFIARAQSERAVASKLLKQIAASAASGQLNFTGVEELCKKYKHSKIVKWLEHRHSYVYTLMASMLEVARSDGVLATAEFLWLKPVDRRFWYVMNSVGRQASVVEVSGPFAHWLAEKKVGRALKTPMVKSAVDALEESMLDTLYIPDEGSWRTYKEA